MGRRIWPGRGGTGVTAPPGRIVRLVGRSDARTRRVPALPDDGRAPVRGPVDSDGRGGGSMPDKVPGGIGARSVESGMRAWENGIAGVVAQGWQGQPPQF